jgi:hypothetical protein
MVKSTQMFLSAKGMMLFRDLLEAVERGRLEKKD